MKTKLCILAFAFLFVSKKMIGQNPLYGKKIIGIGDSMIYGNNVGTQNVWLKLIADRNGMDYEVSSSGNSSQTTAVAVNAGINGVMLSYNDAPFAKEERKTTKTYSVFNRFGNLDNDADVVVVFAGTNDAWALYRREIVLGDEDSVNPAEFNGALNLLMQGLLEKYPNGHIMFITPYDDGSVTRQSIISAIKSAAIRNGNIAVYDNSEYPAVDFSDEEQANKYTQGDNVHLNAEGHALVSYEYEKAIKSLFNESCYITIGSMGLATFCSSNDLDFSNSSLKAYIVSAFKPNKGEVTLTKVDDVPAGTGIIVLGEPGVYEIPITNSETVVSNMLVGTLEDKIMYKEEGNYTNYILANGNNGLGFYAVQDGSTLNANKAYLPLKTELLANLSSAEVKALTLNFDMGINTPSSISEISLYDNDFYYNLCGQLVETPLKGIYIHNGKKIVIQ